MKKYNVYLNHKLIDWVKDMKAGEDGPDTYEYNEGIAP